MLRALGGLVLVVGLASGLAAAAIAVIPNTLYFPAVSFEAPGGLRIEFLQTGRRGRADCVRKAEEVAGALSKQCAGCKVSMVCERGLDAGQQAALSREPLPVYSARRADGALVLTFHAPDPPTAQAVCRESEKASQALPEDRRLACYAAGENR